MSMSARQSGTVNHDDKLERPDLALGNQLFHHAARPRSTLKRAITLSRIKQRDAVLIRRAGENGLIYVII